MRVAVSQRLSPPTRLRLRDLAANTPLPQHDGLIQTEELVSREFPGISERKKPLVNFYFLMARMEKSQEFSQEFNRRKQACRDGIALLDTYIDDLNKLIARAVFKEEVQVSYTEPREFPIGRVFWRESEQGRTLVVLRDLPEPTIEMGRRQLRELRTVAAQDRARLEQRIPEIDLAHRRFLDEAHLIGARLRELRRPVTRLVGRNRAGLPFSF